MQRLREGEVAVAACDSSWRGGLADGVPRGPDQLEGRWAARRGSYRVLYAIDERASIVTVLAAEHRRQVHRRR